MSAILHHNTKDTVVCSHIASFMSAILHHNTKDTPSFVRISRHSCQPFCITTQKTHCRLFAYRVINVPHSAYHNTKDTQKFVCVSRHSCQPFCITTQKTHCRLFAYCVIIVPHSAYHNTKDTLSFVRISRHSCQPYCITVTIHIGIKFLILHLKYAFYNALLHWYRTSLLFPILHITIRKTLSFISISRHSCSPFCISQYETHQNEKPKTHRFSFESCGIVSTTLHHHLCSATQQ